MGIKLVQRDYGVKISVQSNHGNKISTTNYGGKIIDTFGKKKMKKYKKTYSHHISAIVIVQFLEQ